jgi:YidC/Oxa1 family membrane protein insertase
VPRLRPCRPSQPRPAGEQVTITTDLVKATLDSRGGSLVRLELLAHRDALNPQQNVVLMEQSAKRLYVAQTGLITNQAGVTLPNHLTPMTVQPGERTLAPGAKDVQVRFESATAEGLKFVKTYTFRRGDYTVGVKHEFINQGANTGHPSFTCSWRATATRPRASRASTSPSPARPCTPS